MLRILDTAKRSAQENMDFDDKLLQELKGPTLHLYEWSFPSVTFGHFIRPEEHFQAEAFQTLCLGRRPTGGGVTFHLWDYAFSFLLPASHPDYSLIPVENYRFVNEMALKALQKVFLYTDPQITSNSFEIQAKGAEHFCMARPTKYDVVCQGKKVIGAAQRNRRQGYLHQGTISLQSPDIDFLQRVLLSEKALFQAIEHYTHAPLTREDPLEPMREKVKQALTEVFQEHFHE